MILLSKPYLNNLEAEEAVKIREKSVVRNDR